jgi:hypothetical protein
MQQPLISQKGSNRLSVFILLQIGGRGLNLLDILTIPLAQIKNSL